MTSEQEQQARLIDKNSGFKYPTIEFVSTKPYEPVFTDSYDIMQDGVWVGKVYRESPTGQWTTDIELQDNRDQYRNDLFVRIRHTLQSRAFFKAHSA